MTTSRKMLKSLHTKKGRAEHGLYMVEGKKFTDEIPPHAAIEKYVVSKDFAAAHDMTAYAARAPVDVFSRSLFDSVADTATSQGIFALVAMPAVAVDDCITPAGFVVMCERISDPGNVGVIIRTAAAAGADGVLVCNDSACPFSPKAMRASAGALMRTRVVPDVDVCAALETLRRAGFGIYAAAPRADVSAYDVDFCGSVCIIIGNEAQGISRQVRTRARTIALPMHSGESLNAGVAAGILMYEVMRGRGKWGSALTDFHTNPYNPSKSE